MERPKINIGFLHQVSKGLMSHEQLNSTIKQLVNKGLLEQYTNEDGDFEFELTELGREIGLTINKLKDN
tara:strand:+ start:485 stop:691 length:207 start_codon:yes stop_codon:yes gene_type:complete